MPQAAPGVDAGHGGAAEEPQHRVALHRWVRLSPRCVRSAHAACLPLSRGGLVQHKKNARWNRRPLPSSSPRCVRLSRACVRAHVRAVCRRETGHAQQSERESARERSVHVCADPAHGTDRACNPRGSSGRFDRWSAAGAPSCRRGVWGGVRESAMCAPGSSASACAHSCSGKTGAASTCRTTPTTRRSYCRRTCESCACVPCAFARARPRARNCSTCCAETPRPSDRRTHRPPTVPGHVLPAHLPSPCPRCEVRTMGFYFPFSCASMRCVCVCVCRASIERDALLKDLR